MLIKNLFKYWTYQVFSPGTVLREKYEAFKSLLAHDKRAHEIMAELEEIYYDQIRVDFQVITEKYNRLSESVSNIIEDLSKMCPSRYHNLRDYFKKFDFYIRFMIAPPEYDFSPPFTISLKNIPTDGHPLVGGKALNLSVIKRNLQLPIPSGFVITTNAFHYFIEYNDLRKPIDEKLSGLDISSTASLDRTSHELIALIMNASIPPDIKEAIFNAFEVCPWANGKDVRVAMRSSAVGEDTRSSFAGQYRTVLNVGEAGILDAYQSVVASKYSPRALYYRVSYGFSDMETPMAVLALEMIDARASGVMYTKDLDEPESNHISIHSIWGLGELLVGGEASPDVIRVARADGLKIWDAKTVIKSQQMIFSAGNRTESVSIPDDRQHLPSLDNASALTLAKWGIKLEDSYKEPQDIEWCMDDQENLFLLQSRPLAEGEVSSEPVECSFEDIENDVLVSGGDKASSGIGAGSVFKINHESDLENLPVGSVLVTKIPLPHYVKVLDKVSAVVTDIGSTAGHFASVAREFGIPVLVNTGYATEKLSHGREVTVHADGKAVYDGIVQSMLESPCARRNLLANSPFNRKMKYMMSFISPLALVDPQDKNFTPEGCRSLHDIIRFSHEKAVFEMFSMGNRRLTRKKGARKLVSTIPMQVYVLDVGGGLTNKLDDTKTVHIEEVRCIPMRAIWKGLNHPDIHWSVFSHFDWAEYDKIVMSGGNISADSALLSSYVVLSRNYLNLALKFGYHFVILDTICGEDSQENHIMFRFTGGGGDYFGKSLRTDFLKEILNRLGFKVDKKGELIDGRLMGGKEKEITEKLDILGRLLGATRLMDMYLKEATQVEGFVEDFMNGRYHFASVED